MKRLIELDFLRGIAILLVLLRHRSISECTTNMGWIGVDLFFVLSGFLVAGLLFKEYIKLNTIDVKRFLIRRGFKIYPLYYLTYLFYLIYLFCFEKIKILPIVSDLLFVQNYILGLGFAYPASWSLAIEEHFYIFFSIALLLGLKYKWVNLTTKATSNIKSVKFENIIFITMLFVFIMRVFSNIYFPNQIIRNFTMTHLRIDSLLMGVLIAYYFYFKKEFLLQIYKKYKIALLILSVLFVSWTPFIHSDTSFFVKTIGFSLLYISFGILLLFFILEKNISEFLTKIFGTPILNLVSKIGYCSYSIYIIHSIVNVCYNRFFLNLNTFTSNKYVAFLLTTFITFALGVILTNNVEKYFLNIRNKYFASKV